MSDSPLPPRPGNEPADESPTQPVAQPVGPPAAQPVGQPPAQPQSEQSHDQWLRTPESHPVPGTARPPAERSGRLTALRRRATGNRLAVAALGAVVGATLVGGGVALADGGGHPGGQVSTRNGVTNNGTGNGFAGRPQRGTRAGNGAGNGSTIVQQVLGRLSAVSATSITVATSVGSSTFPVTTTTPVTRNGSTSSVSRLQTGDTVVVYVVPAANGSSPVVQRITAG